MKKADDGDDPSSASEIETEATGWLLRLNDATLIDEARIQQDFIRWRDLDPRHASAFVRVEQAWREAATLSERPEWASHVLDAKSELARLRRGQRLRRVRRTIVAGGAGLVAAALVASLAILFWPAPIQRFDTGIGERRNVTLADGSRVDIDADSALAVDFKRSERLLHLLRGEAYFEVARDRERPFIVETGGRSVIATGTAFDVEALPRGVHVVLVQGHVDVRAGASGTLLAKLQPGDSLVTEGDAAPRFERVDVLSALAWRSGRLIFDDVSLTEAMARMSHYSRQRVVIDPSLADLRISGTFSVRDLAGLLSALAREYPLDSALDPDGTIHLKRRS